jgi:hypothetical protein
MGGPSDGFQIRLLAWGFARRNIVDVLVAVGGINLHV